MCGFDGVVPGRTAFHYRRARHCVGTVANVLWKKQSVPLGKLESYQDVSLLRYLDTVSR